MDLKDMDVEQAIARNIMVVPNEKIWLMDDSKPVESSKYLSAILQEVANQN